MNKFPNDDERLVEFLRQHASDVPPASPNLEQLIMQAVASSSPEAAKRQRLWILPPVIAAGLLLVWTGYRILMPANLSPAQLATLNAFLESNWDGVVGGSAEAQTFPIASPNNN